MRREDALENNLAWYRAMMDAHNILHDTTEHVWLSTAEVPPFYSNLVTRSASGDDEQLACIRALAAVPPKSTWGLADSFAHLDVAAIQSLGFALLFEALWHGVEPNDFVSSLAETEVAFTPVQDAVGLAAWEAVWQTWSPAPNQRVFPPALLDTPGVTFWSALREDEPVGGAITHVHNDTIGLSNVHVDGAAGAGAFLRDAARVAHAAGEGRAIVGYGSAQDLLDLAPLGFDDLGPCRVWLTSPDGSC